MLQSSSDGGRVLSLNAGLGLRLRLEWWCLAEWVMEYGDRRLVKLL
jgi:hypothetical protein